MRKSVLIIIFVVLIIFLIFLFIKLFQVETCGDETAYDECSLIKPYFCLNGLLVERASICGCPESFSAEEDFCVSEYYTNPKDVSLNYIVNDEKKEINFIIYEGIANYLSELPKYIYYGEGEQPSRVDFKLRNINDKVQREALLPLIVEIQNVVKNKKEQAKIAISLVQEIQYEDVNIPLEEQALTARYPYEVLYDAMGVCGEKSDLLSFLLKEIGYDVVIFYFSEENHEAVGVKCPFYKDYKDTGYCYIETTTSLNVQLDSSPEILEISEE